MTTTHDALRRVERCCFCQDDDTWGMCAACTRSYSRTAHRDGSVMEAMCWAACRARRMLKRTQRAAKRGRKSMRRRRTAQ